MTVTKRDQQAEERRRQLLDTALALFAQRGFENTTIKDLAEATGVAQGLVYHYFRSKDELLFAILEERGFLPALRRLLTVSPDRPAAEVLDEVAHGFSDFLTERGLMLRIVMREAQTNPRVALMREGMIEGGVELLSSYLAARIRAGELRPHDPRITARAFFSTLVVLHLTRTPTDDFLPAFVDLLLHGVAAS
jgi:AcrR family transcriptional regulator